jgi:hypothetical protein
VRARPFTARSSTYTVRYLLFEQIFLMFPQVEAFAYASVTVASPGVFGLWLTTCLSPS